MKIKLVLNQPYPNGMACTNRVHHYAKGLQEQGHDVEIIIPTPLERDSRTNNQKACGIYDGIPFVYSNDTTLRSKYFLKRRWQDIAGPINTAFRLVKEKTEAVLLVSTRPYHIVLFRIATYVSQAVFTHERSELSFVFSKQKGMWQRLRQKVYNYFAPKCFDGILVISTKLRDFLKPYLSSHTRLLLVPIIADIEEFDSNSNVPSESYIAYAGNLSNFKDGVNTLIDAFDQVAQQLPNIRLYLIGKPSEADKSHVDKLLDKYQLHDQVFQTGYVSRERLIQYLQSAQALVLAKPNNTQANFCFPSKLGEYLATGNLVVTTKVGEISYYLEDGKSALLANPDDAADFAKKLLRGLSDPDTANRIGQAGKAVARENFNYKMQGQRISDFLYQLSHQRKKV